MIHDYIQQQIGNKNRWIYFKKGKWLLHIFFILVVWLSIFDDLNKSKTTGDALLCGAILSTPFLCFFYFYCLYLVPVLFKRNRYKVFWLFVLVLLAVLPLLQLLAEHVITLNFPQFATALKGHSIARVYSNFLLSFMGTTSGLFIMELAEGIRTAKDTNANNLVLQQTERNLVKARIQPDFMLHSLDGIIHLSWQKDKTTPESIILFSDVLRYRLYRSAEPWVALDEEYKNLTQLFLFHNKISGREGCSFELAGEIGSQKLPPLTLINIVEPLMNSYDSSTGWSLFFYLNVEGNELQIAIELETTNPIAHELAEVAKNVELLSDTQHTFTYECKDSLNSIRICLRTLP